MICNKLKKNCIANYKKPIPPIYLLQSLQGQSCGTHCLIDFLKLLRD